MAEGTGVSGAGAAVERDGELDRLALVIAAGAGVDGTEQDDRWRTEGGGDVTRAAVGGYHQSAAANNSFGGAEADVFASEAADLRVVGGRFDRRGSVALLRTAKDERCEAELVGGSQPKGYAVLSGPMLGRAECTAGAEQHDAVWRRQGQPLPNAIGGGFVGRSCGELKLA